MRGLEGSGRTPCSGRHPGAGSASVDPSLRGSKIHTFKKKRKTHPHCRLFASSARAAWCGDLPRPCRGVRGQEPSAGPELSRRPHTRHLQAQHRCGRHCWDHPPWCAQCESQGRRTQAALTTRLQGSLVQAVLLFERPRDREETQSRGDLHLLVHSPSARTGRDQTRLEPAAGSPVLVPV